MTGYAIEIGHLVTQDGESTTEYPFALLIEFDSAEDLREALRLRECRFEFGRLRRADDET